MERNSGGCERRRAAIRAGAGHARSAKRGAAAHGCAAVVVAALVLATAGAARADDPPGQVFYIRYCAACHGVKGAGDGPAASAFKIPPTDLTRLAATAGGSYPVADVMASIDGRRVVAAHGSREMPVWGERFVSALAAEPYPGRTTLQKEREIAEYVRTLQRK